MWPRDRLVRSCKKVTIQSVFNRPSFSDKSNSRKLQHDVSKQNRLRRAGLSLESTHLEEKPDDDEAMLVTRGELSIRIVPRDDLHVPNGHDAAVAQSKHREG